MYFFSIFPYAYFLKTRLTGNFQRLSWIFVYFIPSILIFFLLQGYFSFHALVNYTLGMLIINYVYDNGYIQNDVKTTKNEVNPTMRLDSEVINSINNNWSKLLLMRIAVLSFLFSLYYLVDYDLNKTLYLLFFAGLLQVLYLCYNFFRSRINLFLILPLSYIRFYGFIVPFVPFEMFFEFLIFSTFLYPVPKLIEFSKQNKFNLEKLARRVGDIDVFRVKYYALIFVVFFLLMLVNLCDWLYVLIGCYYFLYRLMGLILIKHQSSVRTELKALTKSDFRN